MIEIKQFEELPSTNDYLKTHYADFQKDVVIVASHQTKGRGRFDRVWQSDEDLTFSILCHEPDEYAIVTPLIVIHALKTFGYDAMIKWPNDILLHGKKVCGILIEDIYEGNERICSVIGIGINLTFKSDDYAIHVDIKREALLTEILHQARLMKQVSKADSMMQYRQSSYLLDKWIEIETLHWQVIDISDEGYLVIERDNQRRILRSEEISLQQIYQEDSR